MERSAALRPFSAAILTLALLATSGAVLSPAASAASSPACRITNKSTAQTFRRLKPAVRRAAPGDRLMVRGTCHGGTFINKDLTIVGVRTRRFGDPVLDGDGRTRVLIIKPGVQVRIWRLTIQDGRAARVPDGGGITNRGTLKLRDVIVRRNTAAGRGGGILNEGMLRIGGASRVKGNTAGGRGGGIHNAGILRLRGTSRVKANLARHGGGIHNAGTVRLLELSRVSYNRTAPLGSGGGVFNSGEVTMNSSSSIWRNRASLAGGVANLGGTLTMNDRSSVSRNRAQSVGGVLNDADGRLTMAGPSAISRNRANQSGGLRSSGTLIGVWCAPQTSAKVFWNKPDDCDLS
jgi:hypothetical protein